MRNLLKNQKTSENENIKEMMKYWNDIFKEWVYERNVKAN